MRRTIILFLTWFLLQEVSATAHEQQPRTITKLGIVEGNWKTSFDGRRYASFEGVPYAKPPIGELRFEEAQPAEPWLGVWNATQNYICPQIDFDNPRAFIGSEDCLYLNIYVPEINSLQKLDVVVHIHGGCFMWGYGNQFLGSKYIMDRDLIVVTLNYRLNVLGFLSTEDEVAPGNNGLKDQVLALKWIQENIASFGGKPNSVTLTGFSAGAASVQYHYLSPMSKGLFSRGISNSGSTIAPWATRRNPLKMTRKLANIVGCDLESTTDLVRCLKTRPVKLLVESISKNLFSFHCFPLCPMNPVVEKWGENPFITDEPYNLLKSGKIYDVPWISSYTSSDGIFVSIAFKDNLEEILGNWTKIFKYIMEAEDVVPESRNDEIANKVKEFYFAGLEDYNETFIQLTNMYTDRMLRIPAEVAAETQSRATKSPVYSYVFDFEGTNSVRYSLHKNPPSGVYHGDDMVYLYGGQITRPLTKTEIRMKNILMEFLESYAKTGVPTLKGIAMKSVNDQLRFYKISDPENIQMEVKSDYSADELWSNLGLLEGEKLIYKKDEL